MTSCPMHPRRMRLIRPLRGSVTTQLGNLLSISRPHCPLYTHSPTVEQIHKRWSSSSLHRRYPSLQTQSSFTPSKLRAEDYRDFSNIKGFKRLFDDSIDPASTVSHFKVPFPDHCKGFPYLHRPVSRSISVDDVTGEERVVESPIHPMAGELRFRLVDTPDPSKFDEGTDLRSPGGAIWGIHLLNMYKFPVLGAAYKLMLTEKERADIDDFLARSQNHPSKRKRQHTSAASTILNSILEPFPVDFKRLHLRLTILERDYIASCNIHHWLTVQQPIPERKNDVNPYSGKAMVQFGVVHCQRKGGPPVIKPALRVLEWLEPPNPNDIAFQTVGSLVQKWDAVLQQGRPWVSKSPQTMFPAASLKLLIQERSDAAETVGLGGGKYDAYVASLERVTIQIP